MASKEKIIKPKFQSFQDTILNLQKYWSDSGRRKPEIKIGSEFEIKADMVIKALGFDPENLPTLFDSLELSVSKWGTIKTDFDTMETNLKGVFAAGDIVRGASLVVWAIKDGREAATSIKKYLESKEIKQSKVA